MTVAGIVLIGLGALGAVWLTVRGLHELAMGCALVAAAGATMLWGWLAGAGVAVGGVGTLVALAWLKYRA